MKKRILSLLLASLLGASVLAGCSNNSANPAETDNPVQTNAQTPSSDGAAEEEEELSPLEQRARIPDNLPENNFDGREFTVCTEERKFYEIFSEDLNGEATNDSVYQRNVRIEDRFNAKITPLANAAPYDDVIKVVTSGTHAYDVVGFVNYKTYTPASAGVLMYYFLLGVEKNADVFMRTTGSASGALERFPQIISILQDNDVMLISIIAFAAATVIVSVIRRISTDYSMYIAVAVGAVVNVMIFLVGGFTSDANIAYAEVFLGSVISLLLAFAAAFWLVAADYAHAEYLQYEDEGYIYYVRAVPKIKIAKKAVKIHDVSPQDTEEDENRDIEEALKALDAIDEEERKKESR